MAAIKQIQDPQEVLQTLHKGYQEIRAQVARIIVGQEAIVDQMILSLLCNGHCLLIGVPGLAKTLLVQTLSQVLDLQFKRIQFTPDLMPSDIIGSEILNKNRDMEYVRGPIFANMILADEINRTPPKTQSALLEAMQEHAVTIGGERHALPDPFFVLATQNPIEQEGTYPLPEAQLDRFMLSMQLGYPNRSEEAEIVKRTTMGAMDQVKKVATAKDLLQWQKFVLELPVADSVVEYAVLLSTMSRPESGLCSEEIKPYISWGAGPRASQYLILGAKAHAAIQGKASPDREDVQAVAAAVLRHRIIRNYRAQAEKVSEDDLVRLLIDSAGKAG